MSECFFNEPADLLKSRFNKVRDFKYCLKYICISLHHVVLVMVKLFLDFAAQQLQTKEGSLS